MWGPEVSTKLLAQLVGLHTLAVWIWWLLEVLPYWKLKLLNYIDKNPIEKIYISECTEQPQSWTTRPLLWKSKQIIYQSGSYLFKLVKAENKQRASSLLCYTAWKDRGYKLNLLTITTQGPNSQCSLSYYSIQMSCEWNIMWELGVGGQGITIAFNKHNQSNMLQRSIKSTKPVDVVHI